MIFVEAEARSLMRIDLTAEEVADINYALRIVARRFEMDGDLEEARAFRRLSMKIKIKDKEAVSK